MKKQKYTPLFRAFFILFILSTLVFSLQGPARAATTLSVTPITWNVIGLDSNNVNVGPNHFPIGARVCNTGGSAASNVQATFVWDSSNTYINTRPGTSGTLSVPSLAVSACTDFYFEVEVTRDSAAYNTTRRYHIAVTADSGATTGSTPTPRELFVEHLISQHRNSTTDIQLSTTGLPGSYTSVPVGGTMTLMVGQTYWIKLIGFTATNGYEQIETFISLPNIIFQVLSVSTLYGADSAPPSRVPNPNDKLYGDGCLWENNPNDPWYRYCLSTGKAGGDITVDYKVKILSIPQFPLDNPEQLQSLIYDFSGSSYHYNADFGTEPRYYKIVDASIVKAFKPKVIRSVPQETSALTFTISNPGPEAISSVNFVDPLPTNGSTGVMSIDSTSVTYTGCGTPSPSSLTVGATSLSFTNITISGLSTCTIGVTVTVSATGTYNNVTNHLYIGTTDTGNDARDTLFALNQPPGPSTCANPVTLATWTMPTAGSAPPTYDSKAGDVSFANTRAELTTAGSQAITTGGFTTYAWDIIDAFSTSSTPPGVASGPYFEFSIDTSNYGGAFITLKYDLETPGDWSDEKTNQVFFYSRADGGAFSLANTYTAVKGKWDPIGTNVITGTTTISGTGLGITYFRVTAVTRKSGVSTSRTRLDNITIKGCARPLLPTLNKNFNPVSILNGNTSTLRFNFANPNTGSSLSNVSFSDTLPTGLVINTPNGLSGPTCTSGTISGASITATAGTSTISMSGATMSANASCWFSVSVLGNVAGNYHNISGNITSTETGPNTTSTGYGEADLLVIAPPIIQKAFGATYIFTGNTTDLRFTIFNPNQFTTMTGVSFTDVLPDGLSISSYTYPNVCGTGSSLVLTDSTRTILLTGGTIPAAGSCSFNITVTGSTPSPVPPGYYTNTTSNVTTSNAGTGNTATDYLQVRDLTPGLSLLKQVATSMSGPWYSYQTITAGQPVYYRFIVENTGDVPLTSISISDPWVNTSGCTWTNPLPVAVAGNDNHITTCDVQGPNAVNGGKTNTARASGTYNSTTTYSNYSSATYKNDPTAVTMASFTARGTPSDVELSWETAAELNALGFNLYRSTDPDGERVLLNQALIPSHAFNGAGASYQFIDTQVQPGVTYYYWLEFIDIFGNSIFGPASARLLANKFYLPIVLQ